MKDIFWAILKLIAFIFILPLIIATVIAFQTAILSLPPNKDAWLLWGAGTYIALKLFVYDFKAVYTFGNSCIDKVVTFFKPAGYMLPIYSVILVMIYVITLIIGRGSAFAPYFLFFFAFTLAMHLIMTAHEIYEADKSILKAHYLFVFGSLIVFNFIMMALLLAWALPEYSLIAFIKNLSAQTVHMYKWIYKVLFVD